MSNTFTSLLLLLAAVTADTRAQTSSAPPLLTFPELVTLARPGDPPPEIAPKLQRILSEPFLETKETSAEQGDGVRVASWNIERGREWQLIRLALTKPSAFRQAVRNVSDKEWAAALAQIEVLREADILILNEVDYGMKRTGYANVAKELSEALGMNYAFGVEFLEIDPLYTGQERIELDDPQRTQELAEDLQGDPARYLGLHGNAILSRFPIRSVRIHRLPHCYDWLNEEAEQIAALEKGRRWSANRLFAERIRRQIRRGGRMALIAELQTGLGDDERITAVSAHLEDRAPATCRQEQLEDLLTDVRDVPGALVLGGDLNTSGRDGTPTSLRYEVMKRVTDERFWLGSAFRWFTPLVVPAAVLWPVNYIKNLYDPTAVSIPILAPNAERGLFQSLRTFRFADGGRFEFEGSKRHSGNGRAGTLANSNQRAWKGFRSTYRFERTYFGMVGMYRLDWLLVKPGPGGSFRPESPRTLRGFNKLAANRLSDHEPIVVDLRLPGSLSARIADGQ